MTRSVADAAIILHAIAGKDRRDNFTLAQPAVVPDYTKALKKDALRGVRLGVPRRLFTRTNSVIVAAFNASLDTIRGLGATIVDPADFPDFDELEASNNETIVLDTDFKVTPLMHHVRHGSPQFTSIHTRFRWSSTSPSFWTCRQE